MPRSDTVADSAKSDVLKEWRYLEHQGRCETIRSSSKQGLSRRDSVSWIHRRLVRFKLPPVKMQGYVGGDKRTDTTLIHPCLGSLFVTLTPRTKRVTLPSHPAEETLPKGRSAPGSVTDKISDSSCTETTPSRDMLF